MIYSIYQYLPPKFNLHKLLGFSSFCQNRLANIPEIEMFWAALVNRGFGSLAQSADGYLLDYSKSRLGVVFAIYRQNQNGRMTKYFEFRPFAADRPRLPIPLPKSGSPKFDANEIALREVQKKLKAKKSDWYDWAVKMTPLSASITQTSVILPPAATAVPVLPTPPAPPVPQIAQMLEAPVPPRINNQDFIDDDFDDEIGF